MAWRFRGLSLLPILIGLVATEHAFGANTIGNTTVVVKTVTGELSRNKRTLKYEDDIYRNELITTLNESATEIKFLDDTKLTLGPKSRVTLDRFVYDPNPTKSTFVLTVTQGALRFASGVLPKKAYKIHTPVATIGIRGTVIDLVVDTVRDGDGKPVTTVSLTVVEGEAHFHGCAKGQGPLRDGRSRTISSNDVNCARPHPASGVNPE